MKEEEKKILTAFETRVRMLMEQCEASRQRAADLEEELHAQKAANAKLQAQLLKLEEDYTNLKTAKTIGLNGSDVKETKLRLSKLVREVDKCIALLND